MAQHFSNSWLFSRQYKFDIVFCLGNDDVLLQILAHHNFKIMMISKAHHVEVSAQELFFLVFMIILYFFLIRNKMRLICHGK